MNLKLPPFLAGPSFSLGEHGLGGSDNVGSDFYQPPFAQGLARVSLLPLNSSLCKGVFLRELLLLPSNLPMFQVGSFVFWLPTRYLQFCNSLKKFYFWTPTLATGFGHHPSRSCFPAIFHSLSEVDWILGRYLKVDKPASGSKLQVYTLIYIAWICA